MESEAARHETEAARQALEEAAQPALSFSGNTKITSEVLGKGSFGTIHKV